MAEGMADPYPSRDLVKTLATLSLFIRDFDDTRAKAEVYHALLGLITDLPHFRERLKKLEFFVPPLIVLPLSRGMVAYTFFEYQMNIHFAIPRRKDDVTQMMHEMAERLSPRFDHYAINMRPLRCTMSDVEGDCVKLRHTIHRLASPITLHEGTIFAENAKVDVLRVFSDPREVLQYVPLTKLSYENDEDTVYWTKTKCGRLVAFHNPLVPLIEAPTDIPPILDVATIFTCFPAKQHTFLKALNPTTPDDTIDALRDKGIPSRIKCVIVHFCTITIGISDDVILYVGELLVSQEMRPTPMHLEILQMAQLMKLTAAKTSGHQFYAYSLAQTMKGFEDQFVWRRWALHSPFVYYMLDRAEIRTLQRMIHLFPFTTVTLTMFLKLRIGDWDQKDRQKANLLEHMDAGGQRNEDARAVLRELNRINEMASATMREMKEETETRPRTQASRAAPKAPLEDARPTTLSVMTNTDKTIAPGTHHNVLTMLRARWSDITWTLIGSGIFSDESDVDVVAVVDMEQLGDCGEGVARLRRAYEYVQQRTEFEQRGEVDGLRVCTLHASLDVHDRSLPLDVQVMVGGRSPSTDSEESTVRAITLANRLEAEADAAMRENVRNVHRWFLCTDLKGNGRCHLPGVAVTCLAVNITCGMSQRTPSFAHILYLLAERMSQEYPAVNLDAWEGHTTVKQERQRARSPVRVIIDERNVALRITTSWTRHLCDMLFFAKTLAPTQMFDKDVYASWRRQNMVYCVTLRPKTTCSTPMTLYHSLSRFEDHPLIDSYHVGSDGADARNVVLRCTLDANACAKYSFKKGDIVETRKDFVIVTRGGRCTRLNLSFGNGITFDAAEAETMTSECVMFDAGQGRCFPNAPYLSADAIACFSPTHWEVV